jgi:cysteine desulfurase family protein (TIGR01976 family)
VRPAEPGSARGLERTHRLGRVAWGRRASARHEVTGQDGCFCSHAGRKMGARDLVLAAAEIRFESARPRSTPAMQQADARAFFPGLSGADVLLDNAGGSQVPVDVADRVRSYFLEDYVQLGADYRTSRRAVATVEAARAFARVLCGAAADDPVILGPSTSALCAALADAHARAPVPGRDEIVVCDAGHESNIGPWARLADRGYRVRWWKADPETGDLRLEDLEALLGDRTRIVAVHHVSNILGRIEDVPGIVARAHAVGARVVVDGVAFAPHQAVDRVGLGADFYVFSTYKVYGPHMAVLCGSRDAFEGLVGANHFFVPESDVAYRFELGGVSHEGCAGLLGTRDYFARVAGVDSGDALDRAGVERAYRRFADWESAPMRALVDAIQSRPQLRLLGPGSADPRVRVPTVSFVVRGRTSREVVLACNDKGYGIRFGHFYAHRLVAALGLDPADGVVRASLVHYTTLDEVEGLIAALDVALGVG